MKAKSLTTLALAGLMVSSLMTPVWAGPPKMKMTTDIPASITAPDKVDTSIGTLDYFDGVPTEKTVETVYDYLDRSRAVNVFLNSIPALSMYTLAGRAGERRSRREPQDLHLGHLDGFHDDASDREHLDHVCGGFPRPR